METVPGDKEEVNKSKEATGATGATVIPISKAFAPVKYAPKWVPDLRNERNFNVFMDVLAQSDGEGRFGAIVSEAGRGKSATADRHIGQNQFTCVKLLCMKLWNTGSPIAFLRALCSKLGVSKPPGRPADCAEVIIERLLKEPKTVFLDECDMIPDRIEHIRQIAEVTGTLFVLIGEGKDLFDMLSGSGRVWSRTFQLLRFEPVGLADVIVYANKTAGMEILPESAVIISESRGGGDWRVVKRIMMELVGIANSRQSRTVTEEMARLAVKMAVKCEVEYGQNGGIKHKRGRR